MVKKIIIDTDPGIDDATAISLALRSPELEVIGLTSVFGNAKGEVTAQNALRLVELEGHDSVPVARGSDVPLIIPLEALGTMVHGEDGMGNTNPPPPKGKLLDAHAAEFIIQMIRSNPGKVTLVPIGPLTNIALALKLDPGIVGLVDEVVLMGGTLSCPGNISPVAEANIYHDPHAADLVLRAGWPLVMVGLDVTQEVFMTRAYLDEIYQADNPATNLMRKILPIYQKFHDGFFGLGGDIHTHDPSAIVYLLAPHLFHTQSVAVFVETEGRCMGQTVADWHHQWGDRPEVKVCMNVQANEVLALIKERLVK
ncbi:MAG TPA: nucleoside hydrolase [Anaerolineae bacterium]|nr:nucleoside hydrolase [Anaerolineae bacterium]